MRQNNHNSILFIYLAHWEEFNARKLKSFVFWRKFWSNKFDPQVTYLVGNKDLKFLLIRVQPSPCSHQKHPGPVEHFQIKWGQV